MQQPNHSRALTTCIHFFCAALFIAFCFSCRWSLEVIGQELVFIKAEDLIILGLLACFYLRRRSSGASPIDAPIVFFLLAVTASSLLGSWRGTLHNPVAASLYFLKLVEYILACYLVYHLTTDSQAIGNYVRALLFTAVAISIYGLLEYQFPHPTRPFYFYRVFDRGYFQRDSNHMGAFLMFSASITIGLALWQRGPYKRTLLGVISLMLCTTLLLTYSRSAYVAIAVAISVLLILRMRRRALPVLFCVVILVALFAPADVLQRFSMMSELFQDKDSSMTYRYQQIGRSWDAIVEHPLMGIGLGARHRMFYENFYLMLLAETGLIGLGAFMWIISRLYKCAIHLFKATTDHAVKGFAMGYLAGLTGLLIVSLTMVTFFISRIAGPFWLATAIMLLLVRTHGDRKQLTSSPVHAVA